MVQLDVKAPYDPDQHLPNEYLIQITSGLCTAFNESLIDTLESLADRQGFQMRQTGSNYTVIGYQLPGVDPERLHYLGYVIENGFAHSSKQLKLFHTSFF